MKSILKISKLTLALALLTFIGCSKPQESHTQSISSVDGISNAEITYSQGDKTIVTSGLAAGDLQYDRIESGNVTVLVTDASGTTTFADIPSKFINLDATVEVTRNVFQDYFPAEWAAMKGQQYSSIYIKSKKDDGVFYMKCVFTNTDKEIGKYSEDY